MLQVSNNTPFIPELSLFPNEQGVDTLYVVIKATFTINPNVQIAEEQIAPFAEDVYYGEPENSSIKYASEMHVGKCSTDIILVGSAHAPPGKEVTSLGVLLSVGNVEQLIGVFGDRQWCKGKITKPVPFSSMPLAYENAYGGQYVLNKRSLTGEEKTVVHAELRNPIGKGFVGKRNSTEIEGLFLPNLEDPRNLIAQPYDEPMPMCFGVTAPSWRPRVSYAGTYDKNWEKKVAPYLPLDFDKRFFNMAHPNLIMRQFLGGGEAVRIINASPYGELRFDLPTDCVSAKVQFRNRVEIPRLDLETVIIEPDYNRFSMTWRGAVCCDKEALKIETVEIDYGIDVDRKIAV